MNINDSNTALHLLKAKYPINYQIPKKKKIISELFQVLLFLEEVTPNYLINKKTKKQISKKSSLNKDTIFPESAFRLTSYEWGVTYAGLLAVSEVTQINKFKEYTFSRLKMIADLSLFILENKIKINDDSPVYSVIHPTALDDCGALCAAMLKAQKYDTEMNLEPLIENFINYISEKQFRFQDGTLARNRPYKNTLWLDDLFMSVPALALKGQRDNDDNYFDDAIHQVLKFSERMFISEKNLYMHGWLLQSEIHPAFIWGRANGWAVMAMVELLSVLPKKNKQYKKVLTQFKKHITGLISVQSGSGFWHQLLDRNDSYLETSATAIISYSIAKAINEGILDSLTFSPIAILGWNAAVSKITKSGQITGTCVGTGMGFDTAFYYHRPVNKFAAHGYGPMFLLGAEILKLLNNEQFYLEEGALQIKK